MSRLRLSESLRARAPLVACFALCISAAAWAGYVESTRWMSGRWYLADVGNVHQMLVETLHGRFMYSPLTENNHFAWHFTPTLLLLLPFTLLSSYPFPLIAACVLAYALAPLPLYRMARHAGLGRWAALAPGLLFLGNTFVGSVQLADHFEILFVFFFLVAMSLMPRGGWAFWASAVLALGVKEDAGVWVLFYAAVVWWRERRSGSPAPLARRAVWLGALCLAWLAAAAAVMAVAASGQEGNALAYARRAGQLRPGLDNLATLATLFASTGFLALFGGRSTLLVLVPAPLLLAEFPFTRNLLYYYSYPFLPYLFLAAVEGMARIRRWLVARGWPSRKAGGLVAAIATAAALIQFPLPTRSDAYRRFPLPVTARDEYRLSVAGAKLPRTAPVAVQFGLWGITPSRPDMRRLTVENASPEAWVFMDLKAPYGDREEFLEAARFVMDQVQSGRRPLVHDRDQIYLVGPVKSETP